MTEINFHIREGKPRIVSEKDVREYLEKDKDVLRVSTNISHMHIHDLASELAHKKMVSVISEEVASRMQWVTYPSPLPFETLIQGEIIVMNIHRLMDLLKEFGVMMETSIGGR